MRRLDDQVKVVGVCAAGKTTLITCLRSLGYRARQIAQEHSDVPSLWRRFRPAQVTLFLDASDAVVRRRRPGNVLVTLLPTERKRLLDVRQGADFYLLTDALTPEEVCDQVCRYLEAHGIFPQA